MFFDFIQFWLDGWPGNEYFWISHKISGHLTTKTPLGVHPQWFKTTWNRYERFLLLCSKLSAMHRWLSRILVCQKKYWPLCTVSSASSWWDAKLDRLRHNMKNITLFPAETVIINLFKNFSSEFTYLINFGTANIFNIIQRWKTSTMKIKSSVQLKF